MRSIRPFLTTAIRQQLSPFQNHPNGSELFSARRRYSLATGRLEFGPRALGGRCLLADPRRDELRQRLNVMKSRPKFMPCAPVVLEEDYSLYFKGKGSRHMTWTVEATAQAIRDIPAAVHRSGHSRVQLLRGGDCLLLERVLREFKRKTGRGVLLLTSLNGTN